MSAPRGEGYPSLTAADPSVALFERELFEITGIRPEGHPWLKPLRRQDGEPHPFFSMAGEGIHEVGVGPVHAGIIESGHFRFQCHGEEVFHLEIRLGYQHREALDRLVRATGDSGVAIAETVAGDTTIGHAWAHCRVMEALHGITVPPRGEAIRRVALELERLANHVGDLGALCNDVGFLPGAAYFGRMRGDFLNLLMELSGSRFGRGLLRIGGVRFDLHESLARGMMKNLEVLARDLKEVSRMVFEADTVVTRFEKTGTLTTKSARELEVVGPVARASGCDRDSRRDFPCAGDLSDPIPVVGRTEGDVMARALVRWLEIEGSLKFLGRGLGSLPKGGLAENPGKIAPDRVAGSIIEGWRGEIVHLAATDSTGGIRGYQIVDPSFHNWPALAMAMRGNQISDFPLCNKSFNLSYAGHDL
jgi:Ni,Fe-hydrogenase III large subunit